MAVLLLVDQEKAVSEDIQKLERHSYYSIQKFLHVLWMITGIITHNPRVHLENGKIENKEA